MRQLLVEPKTTPHITSLATLPHRYEAVRSEILLPEESGALEAEGMEKTYHFTQKAIAEVVDVNVSCVRFHTL
jgi:hypothetical protein